MVSLSPEPHRLSSCFSHFGGRIPQSLRCTPTPGSPRSKVGTHSTVCVFSETFSNIPSKLDENLPNCFGRRLVLFLEGRSLFPGSMEAWKVLEDRGPLQSCAQAASLCGLEGRKYPLLISWRRARRAELLLLLGAVRPRMLRGTTPAAQKRPCELLVGGEAPAACQAKDCALGVRHL